MTQMFDNFNRTRQPIPNNMFQIKPVKELQLNFDTVHAVHKGGHLTGYWWNWGDSISLNIVNQIRVYVPPKAIVTDEEDNIPYGETEGEFEGQKFYNLALLKSWTLVSIVESPIDGSMIYIWEQDQELSYPEYSEEWYDVEIPLKENQQIVVQLFDFRKEQLINSIFTESPCKWELTPEESLKLVPGIYFLNIHSETRKDDVSSQLTLTNHYEIDILDNKAPDMTNGNALINIKMSNWCG